MSKKMPTVWSAPPHTLAKIAILQSYLSVYFQILGRTYRGCDILYIDAFAGPGEYENSSIGSPVAAVFAALDALRVMKADYSWQAKSIYLAFIEADGKRVAHLEGVLLKFEAEPEVISGELKIRVFSGAFAEELGRVRAWCPHPFQRREPLFAFIDPFGATGVPFSLVRSLLESPCSEVFLNLDADGIARIFEARNSPANFAHLDAIFDLPNQDHSWQKDLVKQGNHKELYNQILLLYKRRLREVANASYVFSFEMASKANLVDYYLVFATKHPRGLEKMKEQMKPLAEEGYYRFVDTTHGDGQIALFRGDDPLDHARLLFAEFKGRTVKYEDLRDWALNESPFLNPKSMLANLQTNGLIRVETKPGSKIQAGKFPEEKIQAIEFARERNMPFAPKR